MKRILFIYLILFLSLLQYPLYAQDLIYNKSVTGVCYAGNKTTRIYIPPPEKFLKNRGSKGGGSITVYYSGFSTPAEKAFEYAVSILETMLPVGTKTTVVASWEKVDNAAVLANSSVTAVVGGWTIDAFKPLALYPVALAEKIAGKNLNSDLEGDISLTVNSAVNWYLGTNGNVPENQYDFVTVVLHELCHGLGFFDSMSADSNTGWYGFGSFPVIYDTFIENSEGKRLTDTLEFRNNTMALLKELTGGNLFFKGPVFNKMTGKSKAKVYAPSTWDDGSSISHLDEVLTLKPDNLMTPFIDRREAIHDPGIYTTSILGDLGWINTRIIHAPSGDTEEHISQIGLSVDIKSDTTFNRDKVGLVYSFDGFKNSDTIFMTSQNFSNHFSATVKMTEYNKEFQYYFYTEDCFQRSFHSPSLYQLLRYKSFIGTDTVKPILSHTPAEYYLETEDSIRLVAGASDNIGIDSVYLEYWINEGPSKFTGIKKDSADSYKIDLSMEDLKLNGGDSLRYRIYAKDSARVANISVIPDSGYYSISIEKIGPVISGYSTDFSDAADDFFKSGFEIKRPIGWQKYGLHTKHPYESPEENNKFINYFTMLRNPIKYDESGLLLEYSDIALVEPGEDGASFGSPDYYDYVVVEASKDFGKSWFSLFDGYDARFNSTWLKTYNSSIVGQNSTAIGKESMFVNHIEFFAPSAVLKTGDTILIRFRLYSDPYANGWGWAIQDLKINPLIDGIEKPDSEKLKLYPNPGKGIIRFSGGAGNISSGKQIRYEIFNTSGIALTKGFMQGDSETVIDISGSSSGIYIIVLYLDDGIRTFKYSLIR